MAYLPNRGDIVHLDFDPSSGREMKGPHFGLVLSGKVFNRLLKFASRARHYPLWSTGLIGKTIKLGAPQPLFQLRESIRGKNQLTI